jgi:hypothetical protein
MHKSVIFDIIFTIHCGTAEKAAQVVYKVLDPEMVYFLLPLVLHPWVELDILNDLSPLLS